MPQKTIHKQRLKAIANAHAQAEVYQREWFKHAELAQSAKRLYLSCNRDVTDLLPENQAVVVNNTRLLKRTENRDGRTIRHVTSTWPAK